MTIAPLIDLGMLTFILNRAISGRASDRMPWVDRFTEDNPRLMEEFAAASRDGDAPDCGELMVLSWRAGNILTQDVDRAWPALERAASEAFEVPPMESESPETMERIGRQLARMRDSEAFRMRYFGQLKALWAALQPVWRAEGLPTAEGMRRSIERQLAGGANFRDAVPRLHFAHQSIYEAVISGAELLGEIAIVPLGLAGGGSTFYTLPGTVIIGFGPDHERRTQLRREQSEHAARAFKVVSDPTRCAILSTLTGMASSITDLASFFDLSQPTVSVHVKMLREAGFLDSEKVNGQTLYQASVERIRVALGAAADELLAPC
ncbi:MAG: ArsR/SmtB family transcription factor [Tepidiformaceae bacterium]